MTVIRKLFLGTHFLAIFVSCHSKKVVEFEDGIALFAAKLVVVRNAAGVQGPAD
jgi:hypothetical protein